VLAVKATLAVNSVQRCRVLDAFTLSPILTYPLSHGPCSSEGYALSVASLASHRLPSRAGLPVNFNVGKRSARGGAMLDGSGLRGWARCLRSMKVASVPTASRLKDYRLDFTHLRQWYSSLTDDASFSSKHLCQKENASCALSGSRSRSGGNEGLRP
jgi:hypothetical protein